ncbi:hypothetical protein Tco_0051709 [Tanacetum coccineum]
MLSLTMFLLRLIHESGITCQLALKIKFEGLHASNTPCRYSAIRPRDQDDPYDEDHPEGEKSTRRQKTSEHRSYVFGESSFGQANESDPRSLASDKCVKKFNPAQYSVEHWKNSHANIFYIKRQKEPGKPKEEVYSNSKIVQVIKTYGELGHGHKFVTNIIVEDYAETGLRWSLSVFIKSTMIWERVDDFELGVESYQHKVNLTAPTITFPSIEKYKMFSIIFKPVYGIIYKNSKKEKRVMRHQEIHKFCDATLKRVLEGLKSYNNDVKHGYVTPSLSNEDVEYLQLFEKEIEERLKHRDQMRRWEMYMNGRPLGSRREHPK